MLIPEEPLIVLKGPNHKFQLWITISLVIVDIGLVISNENSVIASDGLKFYNSVKKIFTWYYI